MSQNLILEDNLSPSKKAMISFFKLYIKYAPTDLGKGIITRNFINPLLPAEAEFLALTPNQAKIYIQYNSVLGRAIYLKDTFFERNEITELIRHIRRDTVVIDIGANIGIYSVSLGKEMGDKGSLWAFEPFATNITHLEKNMALNTLSNYKIFPLALGNENGTTTFKLSDDLMFGSIVEVSDYATTKTVKVPVKKLDTIWEEEGRPAVSVIKIDVEGAESVILEGAVDIIKHNKPVLLLEAQTQAQFEKLNNWLSDYGYKHVPVKGFEKWNYLFLSS